MLTRACCWDEDSEEENRAVFIGSPIPSSSVSRFLSSSRAAWRLARKIGRQVGLWRDHSSKCRKIQTPSRLPLARFIPFWAWQR